MTNDSEAVVAWMDVETTGLRVEDGHHLLQVAAIVTDSNFNELGVFEEKIYYSEADVAILKTLAEPFVVNMHEETGLWGELPKGVALEELDAKLLEWLQSFQPKPGELYLGGNSIVLDRAFLSTFVPKSHDHLSYRSLDMTSVEAFFRFTENRPWFQKTRSHDALEDIRESIASAKYQRDLNKPF